MSIFGDLRDTRHNFKPNRQGKFFRALSSSSKKGCAENFSSRAARPLDGYWPSIPSKLRSRDLFRLRSITYFSTPLADLGKTREN
jgi:hypothetical protein